MPKQTKILAAMAAMILAGSLIFAIVLLAHSRKKYRDTLRYGCRGETPCLACRSCNACTFCHVNGGTCGVKKAATRSAKASP